MTSYLRHLTVTCARLCLAGLLGCSVSLIALAQDTQSDALHTLQTEWAIANYQVDDKKAQKAAFETLLETADKAVSTSPNDAELLIWRGIIKSTYAGVKGGLGALKFAKASKADLEKALEIDPQALAGSAYTSLGTLYFKVPGWPVGFGNDDKAEVLLKTALEINPDGIDPNYFYAEFLLSQKNYAAAQQFYNKALQAPDRLGREVADQGRRQEIQAALAKINAKK